MNSYQIKPISSSIKTPTTKTFLQLLFNAISWTTGQSLPGLTKEEAFAPGSYQTMDYGPVLLSDIFQSWQE